jgi:chorismate mutase
MCLPLVWENRMNIQEIPSELDRLRRDIDGVDVTIALLLVQRRYLADQALQLKAKRGLPAIDPVREAYITTVYEDAANATAVAQAILNWSRGEDHHGS